MFTTGKNCKNSENSPKFNIICHQEKRAGLLQKGRSLSFGSIYGQKSPNFHRFSSFSQIFLETLAILIHYHYLLSISLSFHPFFLEFSLISPNFSIFPDDRRSIDPTSAEHVGFQRIGDCARRRLVIIKRKLIKMVKSRKNREKSENNTKITILPQIFTRTFEKKSYFCKNQQLNCRNT